MVKFKHEKDWWKKYAVYQIYPRSFKDSSQSGIGDLKGITEQLPYLDWLGIKIIWLGPIYCSPMADFGYDISDFKAIDSVFGSMEDFDLLVHEMHIKGMYLVMDFVPNHTSDQHLWFQKSKEEHDPYADYYIWKEGKWNDKTKQLEPPNNWISCFGGPAWTFCANRNQFYLHQFLPEQPDLNFRNKEVKAQMLQILEFWLDKGVDGFRVDAISHLIEHKDFLDNVHPKPTEFKLGFSSDVNNDSNVSEKQKDDDKADDSEVILYNTEQPETYKIVEEWVNFLKCYSKHKHDSQHHILFVMESYAPVTMLTNYYRAGADFPFNFELLSCTHETFNADWLKRSINKWLNSLQDGWWPNWVFSNHDVKRVATRLNGLTDVTNTLLLLLPGTSICYYGDELGLMDIKVSFEQCQDPFGRRMGPKNYKCTRDGSRSPMPWTSFEENAGFSKAKAIWLPLNDDWKNKNVESQTADFNSHLNFFRRLLSLKQGNEIFYKNNGQNFIALESGLVSVFMFVRLNSGDMITNGVLVILQLGFQLEKSDNVTNGGVHLPTFELNFGTCSVVSGRILLTNNSYLQWALGASVNFDGICLCKGEVMVIEFQLDHPQAAAQIHQPVSSLICTEAVKF